MTNCGPGGSGTESCCASIEVPGGTFNRTYDPEEADGGGLDVGADGGALGLADPTTVSGFRLDKYLVTVGRFRQFVAAWNGGYYPAAGSGKHTHLNGGQGLQNGGAPGTYETGWDASWDNTTDIDPTDANMAQCEATSGQGVTWTSSVGSNENLPINCTTWWEAYAFCIWDGGFLPSEAEWEYAAAGGGLQLEYPWGSTDPGPRTSTPSSISNTRGARRDSRPWGPRRWEPAIGDTSIWPERSSSGRPIGTTRCTPSATTART